MALTSLNKPTDKTQRVESRIHDNLLKDFARLYGEYRRFPIGTYLAPLDEEERNIIENYLKRKNFSYTLCENGLYYVKFLKPAIEV